MSLCYTYFMPKSHNNGCSTNLCGVIITRKWGFLCLVKSTSLLFSTKNGIMNQANLCT